MKQVIINIPDKKYPFFIELVKSLGFVKKMETIEDASTSEQLKSEIRQAVEEMKLIKSGKLKGRPVQELLDEL